jgi:hypothetical protein
MSRELRLDPVDPDSNVGDKTGSVGEVAGSGGISNKNSSQNTSQADLFSSVGKEIVVSFMTNSLFIYNHMRQI